MRRLLPLVFLVAGCQDYGKLQKDFCATADVPFCDDFEANVFDPTLWQASADGESLFEIEHYRGPRVAIAHRNLDLYDANDPEYAYRGKSDMHILLPGDVAATAKLAHTITDEVHKGTLEMRFFINTGVIALPGPIDLVRFLGTDGTPQRRLSVEAGVPRLTDDTNGTTQLVAGQIFPGGWHCVEVTYEPTRFSVIVDYLGTFELDLTIPVTPATEPLGSVEFGAARTAQTGSPPAELWLDEVVMSPEFIGCTR